MMYDNSCDFLISMVQNNLQHYAFFHKCEAAISHIYSQTYSHSEKGKIHLDCHGALSTRDLSQKEINGNFYRLYQNQKKNQNKYPHKSCNMVSD